MDSDSSRHDNQESKLHSHVGNSKPDIMQLQYLKEITDNFSDERILGQGGFGVVYKGVPQNGEMVAIKKLLQPMPNFLKQFKNEVDLLMRLKHPNIVRLIGYCYETQNVHMDHNGKFIFAEVTQCLLCLEFLPKGSLDAYISDESCGLDWLTRYTIIEGICNGLQYLHEQINPIIHLDLKPANILLTNNMVPKLTDFGLSRLLDQQQTMCTLIATGTRGYMPPEYIQGGTITPMSDIFSLGVIILELVTGHRDYPDLTRTSSEEFIELTLKKWSNVLAKAPGYPSLEIDCQQIKKCIQIGLMCVNPERTKRPTAAKVIKMLQGLESMDCQGGNEITSSSPQSRSGPRELLDIYPLELCFSLDPEKPCLVKLTNKTDGYVAFHFKATRATMRYCIEPSSGFLWPRSPLNVVLKIEERCELPPDLQCHDEFLVQSITVSMERLVSEHITEDTFNKVSSKAVQKVNLTVVYEPPAQPPPLLRVGSDETNTTNLQQLEGLPVEAAGEEALKDDVYTAAAYGDLERLQRLVEAEGQQVTEPDRLGYHALHWAALNNRVGAAKYILEHGADVNAVDCTGQTALHWSSLRGHVQVAELLLKEGAKADAADLYGYQVTHVAAQYGQTLFIHHVVAKWNANPDVPDYNGRSPLHWAAYKGFADSIRLLLHLDAYRLRLDIEGCTPLHWAAIMGNLGACTVLVQAGKKDDLTLKDKTGLTPAQLAANKRHREVAAFLVSSAESIIALVAPIDFVKQRMEATYAALQNAAELAQLSQSVEHVFSVGDLPEAAETLATMRHCLSAGGEVAEFAKTRKQLEVLEERLDEIIQPCLFDTLSNHKVDAVQDFRGMLTCIRNFNSWKVRDTKIHVKPLKELWEDFEVNQRANRVEMMKPGWESISSVSFSSWLPSFYDETVLYLEQEWKWCSTIFPGGFRSLVPIVLVETMSELNSSFVSRLNKATGYSLGISYVAKGVLDVLSGDLPKSIKLQNAHLVALIELHNMTGTFARNIRHLFLESDRGVLLNTMKAIYSPYETFKVRYGQMEYAVLAAAIASIDSRGTIPGGAGAQGLELSETVHRMNKSIPQMIAFLEAAVERCISLTGGSEADELVLVLDDIMLQYISNLQETLKPLRTVCGLDATAHCDASKKDAGLEKKEATRLARVAFQVLTIAECLTSRTSVFEASLRDSLARIGTYFSRSRSRFTLDIATIRLTSLPDKSEKLFAVLEQSKDLRFHVLPVASQRVAAFSEIVNELVYDVLMSRVRQSLSEIALLPIWSSMEEQSGPSFSAYPQEYVTSVGDYLLTLPQHCLEPLDVGITGSGAGSDVPEFNAEEWISKVAEGATALFMEQLRGIHYITDRGALQLAADIEYLDNVLSALSMPILPFLSTFHACISTPRDQVCDLIKSDGGSQLDLPTAHLVSKIRRIPLDQ